MATDLSLGILPPEAWAAAVDLSAREFFDEPFVREIYGPEPLTRYAGTALVGVVEGIGWEFEGNVRRAHGGHGDHGWVSRVAVEPVLHGHGIGRRVLAAALGHLEAAGAPAVLLECQDHLVAFYEACGFDEVGTFPDPAGPDAHLMRSVR